MLALDLIFISIRRVVYGSSIERFYVMLVDSNFRTKEIFDIITDFPDSIGALQDLREL